MIVHSLEGHFALPKVVTFETKGNPVSIQMQVMQNIAFILNKAWLCIRHASIRGIDLLMHKHSAQSRVIMWSIPD